MKLYRKSIKCKIILVSLAVLFVAASFVLLVGCEGHSRGCTISYLAKYGGEIEGNLVQTVSKGSETSPVTAVALYGYYFVQWSDGYTEATRNDVAQRRATYFAYFAKLTYSVVYQTDGNGVLVGETEQSVLFEEVATTVTAVPNEGYKFVKWSDTQSTNPVRTDTVTEDIFAVAIFEEIANVYTYHYSGATPDPQATEIEISYSNYSSVVLTVPQRTNYVFRGWFFNNQYTEMVADENGYIVLDKEDFFANPSRTLYARWVNILFKYNYNYATGNNDIQSVQLDYYNLQASKLVVPTRNVFTFEGWYADAEHTIRVSDEDGRIVIGQELFRLFSRTLYAKWTPSEVHDYKILLVYVTQIDAMFTNEKGEKVHVKTALSDRYLRLCELITMQFRKYINSMLEGSVNFIVDEYYTIQPINEKCFYHGTAYRPDTYADRIPEVQPLIGEYDSTIVTVDLDYGIPYAAGIAGSDHACVYLPSERDREIDGMLAMEEYAWNSMMDTYVHEFIHTVDGKFSHESGKHYLFHTVLNENHMYHEGQPKEHLAFYKLFLLNQAPYKGLTCGIPYEIWRGDIVTIKYVTKLTDGSTINRIYKIIRGGSCTTSAYEDWGNEFAVWSDGVTTRTRTDTNIQSSFTVTAITRRLVFKLKIEAQEGGTINRLGLTEEVCNDLPHNHMYAIYAIPDDGYEFVGWSNGETEEWIYFGLHGGTAGLFTPDRTYTLVAYFRKKT